MTSESPTFIILIVLIAVLIIIGGVALLLLGLIIPAGRDQGPSQTDVFTFSGTATYVNLEGGFWGFIADDGTNYLPVDFAENPGLIEGQKVQVTAIPADVSTIQMWGKPIRVLELVAQVPATPTLATTLWVLDAMRENQSLVSIPSGIRVTLTLSENETFHGTGPVNQYFGSYNPEEKILRFGPVGSTKMAGSPERMELETRYFSMLGEVRSYEILEQTLTMKDGLGSAVLAYHAEANPS